MKGSYQLTAVSFQFIVQERKVCPSFQRDDAICLLKAEG
jgi:hypothetical protein